MHHTDYNSNLRKAQHKTLKNLSLSKSERVTSDDQAHELTRAVVAAILVIVALFQMDPANAQTSTSISGKACPTLVSIEYPATGSGYPTPNLWPMTDDFEHQTPNGVSEVE